jgi:uncharacterized protein YndB with AHSA1/START domain
MRRNRSDRTQMSVRLDRHGRPTMRFERTYAYDAEEVWRALTGDVDPVPDDSVVVAEAPSRLVCTAGDVVVRWTLTRRGDGTRIVLTHVVGSWRDLVPGAARCHSALEQIDDTLDGRPPSLTYDDLVRHYSTLAQPAA